MKRWTSNALLKEKTKQERPMQCPALRLTELWCHINKITISGFDYNNHQAVVYWSLVNKAVHILRAQAINQSKDEYCKHMHTQAHTHMYAYTHSQTHTYTQSQTHTTKTLTHIKKTTHIQPCPHTDQQSLTVPCRHTHHKDIDTHTHKNEHTKPCPFTDQQSQRVASVAGGPEDLSTSCAGPTAGQRCAGLDSPLFAVHGNQHQSLVT